MKIAIYSRKSKFTGKGESIENQIEMCKAYILSRIDNVTENDIIIYEDEGFSGKNFQRPQFQKMLSDADKQLFHIIVCYRLDRISRNVSDFSSLIEKLNIKKISFICIKEQFDTSTPMGRAMMYIASVFAQLERETIAERIRDNMLMLARTGRWLGGNTPTGFESIQEQKIMIDDKMRTSFKLSPITLQIKIVKHIFDKFLELESLTQLETYLIQNGIHSKNNNEFSRFTLKEILSNPVYCIADENAYNYFESLGTQLYIDKAMCKGNFGFMPFNRKYKSFNNQMKNRETAQWIIALGEHKGIISSENWIKAQQILDSNKHKSYRKIHNSQSLLSGLIFCKNCGHHMRPKNTGNIDKETGIKLFSYICEYKEKSKGMNCNAKNCSGHILDQSVCNLLLQISIESPNIIYKLLSLRKKLECKTNGIDEITILENMLLQKKETIQNLVFSLSKNPSDMILNKYVQKEITELDLQCEKLDFEIKNKHILTNNIPLNQTTETINDLYLFENNFYRLSIPQKREFLRTLIKKIEWDGETAELFTN